MRSWNWFLLGAFILALAACGSDGGSGDGNVDAARGAACEGPGAPPTCGMTCGGDGDCGGSAYCGPGQTCTADCTPTGNQCGAGQVCGINGRCRPSNQIDAAPIDCPGVAVTTQPIIPTVQILIDHSGSMDQSFGNVRRVDAVRNALLTPDTGIVAQLQSKVRLGASLYTAWDDDASMAHLPCPYLPASVSPALDNYAAIDDALRPLLQRNQLGEDTPTGESLEAVAALFPAPGPNDKQIIVLATDGEPDTCADPDPPNSTRQQAANRFTEDIAQRIHDEKGIDIFILSVGNDVSDTHLQRMANVGVGKPRDESASPAPFYKANNSEQLVTAFNDIIRGTRECKFAVNNGRVTDPTEGKARLNGQPLEYPTDWDMLDETTLELKGEACQTYLNADVATLTAEFPCGTVIIVE